MKRILSFLLALTLVFSMVPSVAVQAATSGDYTYNVENGEATIIGYTGNGGDITIPSTLGGYPVTTIGDYAFGDCTSLTSVTIPDNVTTIGDWAFFECHSLTSVTIPSCVTTIGKGVFTSCYKLTGIWVDESNPSYSSDDRGVLFNKEKTVLIQAPGGISGAYTIPDNVTTIEVEAFYHCTSLTSVTIGDSVTTIGDWAFGNCTSLTGLTIGNSVTTIGGSAFSWCSGLTSVTIGDNVTTIGDSAFIGCNSLTSVIIGDSVTTIGKDAFSNCDNLTSVTIGDSVTTIGDWAFYKCTSMTSVTIPDSVTTIGDSAFYYCTSLTDVYYNGTEAQWNEISIDSSNDPLLNATIHFAEPEAPENTDYTYTVENGEATITGYTGAGGDITIPATLGGYPVTTIGEKAFEGLENLTSVVIPDSVVSIGEDAFFWCENLQSVTLGNSVKTIGASAFAECALSTIAFPDSVTTIGSYAFHWCALKSVHLPASVTELDRGAFFECGAPAVWVAAENPAYSNDADGNLYNKDKTVFVQAHTGISGEYVVPDSVEVIADSAFEGRNQLTSVIVPADVTIGNTAFDSCQSLTTILFKGDAVVEDDAFNWVPKLEYAFRYFGATVEIGEGNYYLDDAEWGSIRSTKTVEPTCTENGYIEYVCGRLEPTYRQTLKAPGHTEVILPAVAPTEAASGLTEGKKCSACGEILTPQEVVPMLAYYTYTVANGEATITGYEGFGGAITIPSELGGYPVVTIGEKAFCEKRGLTSVVIPDSVTTIGRFAFDFCKSLTSVTIPCSVTTIDWAAFHMCDKLSSVVIPNSVTTIGDWAFTGCSSLTSVTIPDNVTTIGGHAFSYCDNLTSVTIPDNVTTIGDYAFYSCDNLTSVTIPDSVTTIGDYTFCYCDNLTSVTIGYSVTQIDEYAFYDTPLTEVYYGDTEERWNEITIQDGNEDLLNATIYFSVHTHHLVAIVTEPTCTAAGYTTYTCDRCDYSYTDNYVVALGHTEETIPAVAPTCEGAGLTVGKKCAVCGKVLTAQKPVAALGHKYESKHFDAADGVPGYTRYTCSRCGDTYTDYDAFCITTQPLDAYAAKGKIATFTVVAEDAVSYQWQRIKQGATKWTNITGATEASYCVTVSSSTIIPYRCVLTDSQGNQLITDEVTIIEPAPLVTVLNEGGNLHVIKNTVVSFHVELDSVEGVTFQWQREKIAGRWFNVKNNGYDSDTVSFTASPYGNYPYRCEITDANGTKIYSGIYTLTFYEPPVNPRIVKNPVDAYVLAGGTTTFTVQAEGSSFIDDGSEDTGVTYQWWRKKGDTSWIAITDATTGTTGGRTATLGVKVYSNMGEYQYMCEVKDGYGNTLKTKVVKANIITAVKITAQPTAILAEDGATATFSFTATGDVKTYRWERLKSTGWTPISYDGYNTDTLTTTVKSTYRCKITDLAGNVTYTRAITFTK